MGVSTDDNCLYYMRARYYNPEIKRFINQDVLIGSIGNSASLNRYSYVEGNPVSYTDPFGLSPYKWISLLIHGGLDIIGIWIPGADFVNAIYYALEGNMLEAGKSLIYMIPGADLFAKGSKITAKAGKYSEELTALLLMIDKGGHIAAPLFAAYDFGSGIDYMIDKYMVYESEASAKTAVEIVLLFMGGYQTARYKDMFGDYFCGTPKPTTSTADMGGSADKTVVIEDATTSGHWDINLQLFGGNSEGGTDAVNPNALKYNGDGTWTSNEGLIYGQGSIHGNRVNHVLAHTQPDPSKPRHTVFNVD